MATTPATQYIYFFGAFSLVAAIAYIVTSIRVNPKPKVVKPVEPTHYQQMGTMADQVRESRNRFKKNIKTDRY